MSILARFFHCIAAFATLAAVGPSTARAHWDSTVYVETDKISIALEGGRAAELWSPEQARSYATWATRIGALVPEGTTLSVAYGSITVCDERTETCRDLEQTWDDTHLFNLFELTADIVEASGPTIARARRARAIPLTVQVAAGYDRHSAQRLAARINATDLEFNGFFEVATSGDALAHVVEAWQGDGPMYHVVVGAFLDRADATAARVALRQELGLSGFVRGLEQGSVSVEPGC